MTLVYRKKDRFTGASVGFWTTDRGAVYNAEKILGPAAVRNVDFKVTHVGPKHYTWQRHEPGVAVAEGLYPAERRIYAELFVQPLTVPELAEVMRGEGYDGIAIFVHLSTLNKKLAKLGQCIEPVERRDGLKVYRIELMKNGAPG